jgi:glutamate synthase domain-containing protein 1
MLKIESFDDTEYLLFSGFDNNGASLDQETCKKLFNCNGAVKKQSISERIPERLSLEADQHAKATINRALEENSRHFNEARERLEKWEKIKQLERKKRRQRQQIFDIEDEIMEKRDNLIDALEKRLKQKTYIQTLFIIQWSVV